MKGQNVGQAKTPERSESATPWKSAQPTKLRIAAAFTFGFTLLYAAVCASFFIKRRIFESLGVPPLYLDLLIQAFVAFLLIVAMALIFRITLGERVRRDTTRPFLDAMDRIARGDYSVRLDDSLPGHHPMAGLIDRFNVMAGDLDKVEQLRKDFVSNVSHEIQSPLTSIRGFAQALRKVDLSPGERAHYLDIVEEESMRLSKLGDNLVKLAALESEQVRPSPSNYRLAAQLRKVALAAEPQWSAKGLDLDLDLAEVGITADPELLDQVWTNLLHNSVKFTPKGGKVRIALERSGTGIEVSFTDTGIGIGAEDRERIFERFFKADKARRWSGGGSGLGLSIVKRIVDLHGGKIRVESQVGQGTRIIVFLAAA